MVVEPTYLRNSQIMSNWRSSSKGAEHFKKWNHHQDFDTEKSWWKDVKRGCKKQTLHQSKWDIQDCYCWWQSKPGALGMLQLPKLDQQPSRNPNWYPPRSPSYIWQWFDHIFEDIIPSSLGTQKAKAWRLSKPTPFFGGSWNDQLASWTTSKGRMKSGENLSAAGSLFLSWGRLIASYWPEMLWDDSHQNNAIF